MCPPATIFTSQPCLVATRNPLSGVGMYYMLMSFSSVSADLLANPFFLFLLFVFFSFSFLSFVFLSRCSSSIFFIGELVGTTDDILFRLFSIVFFSRHDGIGELLLGRPGDVRRTRCLWSLFVTSLLPTPISWSWIPQGVISSGGDVRLALVKQDPIIAAISYLHSAYPCCSSKMISVSSSSVVRTAL